MNAVSAEQTLIAADSMPKLSIKITWKYLLAFFALTIILGELHEQSHITLGRIVCGEYGARDFNVWGTAENCAAPAWKILSSFGGPIFSYLVMWSGVYLLLKAKTFEYKSLGLTLIFAPLPFARIFTALMGGGDEKVFLHYFLKDQFSLPVIKIFAAIFVLGFCLPPIIVAYRSLANRFRALYVVVFCVLPLIVLGLYVLTSLNGLLAQGFMSEVLILGTPRLILFHFLLMTVILIFTGKSLLKLSRQNQVKF